MWNNMCLISHHCLIQIGPTTTMMKIFIGGGKEDLKSTDQEIMTGGVCLPLVIGTGTGGTVTMTMIEAHLHLVIEQGVSILMTTGDAAMTLMSLITHVEVKTTSRKGIQSCQHTMEKSHGVPMK